MPPTICWTNPMGPPACHSWVNCSNSAYCSLYKFFVVKHELCIIPSIGPYVKPGVRTFTQLGVRRNQLNISDSFAVGLCLHFDSKYLSIQYTPFISTKLGDRFQGCCPPSSQSPVRLTKFLKTPSHISPTQAGFSSNNPSINSLNIEVVFMLS